MISKFFRGLKLIKNTLKVSMLFCPLIMIFGCQAMNGSAHLKATDFFQEKGAIKIAEAAAIGDFQALDSLKSSGENINSFGKYGMTPLLWAIIARNNSGAKRILELGASPNASLKSGDSVASLAAGLKNFELLKLILDHGGNPNHVNYESSIKPTPLFIAISNLDTKSVGLLVKSGADLNYKRLAGMETPLMAAAALNQWEMVHIMLMAGADYKVKNTWGNTIVYYIENNNIVANTDLYGWRQKVVDFLLIKRISVAPKLPLL